MDMGNRKNLILFKIIKINFKECFLKKSKDLEYINGKVEINIKVNFLTAYGKVGVKWNGKMMAQNILDNGKMEYSMDTEE